MSNDQHDYETDLISVVAHDLKIPISAAKGFVELLPQLGPLTDQQKHFVKRAMEALDRMQALVSDLLDYSRLDNGIHFKREQTDLRNLIEQTLSLLNDRATERKIDIHINIRPDAAYIFADAQLMRHVTDNLISNAIKYNRDDGNVWIQSHPTDSGITVEIRDTGEGIAPEDLPRIFERFFRARRDSDSRVEGSGLGLAIVEAVIRMHGGSIDVNSTPGEGTSILFTLPYPTESHPADMPATRTELHHPSEQSDGVDDSTQESDDLSDRESRDDTV